MTAAPSRRGVVVCDSFNHNDEGQALDPAELEASRLHLSALTGCDIRHLYYDQLAIADPLYCHVRFLEQIAQLRPDFIWYHPVIISHLIHRNIRPEILFAARALYGPKLVFSFADLAYRLNCLYSAGYAAIGDVSASWDGNGFRLAELVPGRTVLDLSAPRDARVFHDRGLARDIDVSFIGSIQNYPDRQEGLRAIEALGIAVTIGGGQGAFLSGDGYAALLGRSKITLNFSLTIDGQAHQLKGRVIESMLCGALLFESENDVTPRFLTPYRHYVPFGDAADLAAKIRRYLADDAAREAIAAEAKAHVTETMSERMWWRRVLDALDQARIEAIRRRQPGPTA